MRSFTDYLVQQKRLEALAQNLSELQLALEHNNYPNISGTNNSYRIDPPRTHAGQKHAHVYAKKAGKGKELYSVNMDGSGHDGFSGTIIPKKHADYFRNLGFTIPLDLALESLDYSDMAKTDYEWQILDDDE